MREEVFSPVREGDPSERIAALIPAYNEELVLEGTVRALLEAGCPLADIYVVDDRSTDRTAEIARSLGVNLYTVPQNGGKARAQVAALAEFKLIDRYDWVVFLDGDTKVDRQFLSVLRETAAKGSPEVTLYVGQVCSVRNDHLFSALRTMEYTFGHDLIKQGQSNCNVVLVSPGCASMYRTRALRDLHIDDSTLAEDMDLTIQTHRHRQRVVYVSAAIVYTQDPSTLRDYYKQVLRWHRGFWQIVKKHRIFSPMVRKSTLDLYIMFMVLDTLLFNKLVMGAILLMTYPRYFPYVVAADFVAATLVALYGAVRNRRPEVFYKFPLYYWISFVNLYAYLAALVDIIVLGKTKLSWNKVKRYDFDASAISLAPNPQRKETAA